MSVNQIDNKRSRPDLFRWHRLRIATALTCVAVWAVPAVAEDAPKRCTPFSARSLSDPPLDLHPGKIVGGKRGYLLGGAPGCPSATPTCRLPKGPYLVPDNAVVVEGPDGAFACVHYANGRSEVAGWLPTQQVAIKEPGEPKLPAWRGNWKLRDNSIRLETRGDRLHGRGEAAWVSAQTVNTGDFQADARPEGSQVSFSTGPQDNQCKLSLTLIEKMLVVLDNRTCGGLNVSFSGLYVRGK